MFRKLAILTGLALLAMAVPAQAATPRPIVYTVVIDGLDGDRVDAGKAPFISSLLAGRGRARDLLPRVALDHGRRDQPEPHGDDDRRLRRARRASPATRSRSTRRCDERGHLQAPAGRWTRPSCRRRDQRRERRAASRPRPSSRRSSARATPTACVTAAIFGKPKLGRIFAGGSAARARRRLPLGAVRRRGADDDDYCGKCPTNPITGYAMDDATVMDEVLRTMREGVGRGEAPARLHLREPAAGGHRRPRDGHRHRRLRRRPSATADDADQAPGGRAARRAASGAGPC